MKFIQNTRKEAPANNAFYRGAAMLMRDIELTGRVTKLQRERLTYEGTYSAEGKVYFQGKRIGFLPSTVENSNCGFVGYKVDTERHSRCDVAGPLRMLFPAGGEGIRHGYQRSAMASFGITGLYWLDIRSIPEKDRGYFIETLLRKGRYLAQGFELDVIRVTDAGYILARRKMRNASHLPAYSPTKFPNSDAPPVYNFASRSTVNGATTFITYPSEHETLAFLQYIKCPRQGAYGAAVKLLAEGFSSDREKIERLRANPDGLINAVVTGNVMTSTTAGWWHAYHLGMLDVPKGARVIDGTNSGHSDHRIFALSFKVAASDVIGEMK